MCLFGLTICLLTFLSQVNYVSLQGYNPSDDGVVLAQAFRVLNGEMPHSDFISIRPAFSGLLHASYSILPGDLIPKSRWFVILEYLSIAATFSYLLFKQFKKQNSLKGAILISFSAALIFWMSGIKFLLFPWTTIDALFLSGFGLLAISFSWQEKVLTKKVLISYSVGLGLLALAVLSRQTFFLAFLAGIFFFTFKYLRKPVLRKWLAASIIGGSPLILYIVMLASSGGFLNFLTQMKSQTSFYDTAISVHIDLFLESYIFYLTLILLVVSFILKMSILEKARKPFLISLSSLVLGWTLWMGFELSYTGIVENTPLGFDLFWAFIFFTLIRIIVIGELSYSFMVVSVILLSWLSSISVGSNSFYFSYGILFLALVIYSSSQLVELVKVSWPKWVGIISFGVYALFCSYMNFQEQKNFNYRDVPQVEFTSEISTFSDFGTIMTNSNTNQYFEELDSIINTFDDIHNHFVSVPNNAIIYPITESRNPLSLDWLQPAEYSGQEDRLNAEVLELIQKERTYFIVEKIDSKRFNRCLCTQDLSAYEYTFIIKEKCESIMETTMFSVYRNF